jgi:hypothetical protein
VAGRELTALLDANGIPAALFTTEAVAGYCATRLEQSVDSDDVADAMHVLHRFSLLTIDETADAVRMHNLVQRAVREATHTDHNAEKSASAKCDNTFLVCGPGRLSVDA